MSANRVPLPAKWIEYLETQPETGMSYQVGRVQLRSGAQFEDVVFMGGEVVEVRGHEAVPFDPNDIEMLELTHHRWRFR